jgi:flagella basal body P-ring formation protein FlgA
LSFSLQANISTIKRYVSEKFLEKYPSMHIDNLDIKRYSKPPREFEKYKLEKIHITKNNLKKEHGNLSVTFKLDKKRKRLIYSYHLEATVDVLKANQYIPKGTTLTDDQVDFVNIKFTNFYQEPITVYHLNSNRARTSIKIGKILTTRHISKVTTLKRGDSVTATLRDGYVSVSFQAIALKDAYIGDIIKIKKDYKKFFKAKVISRGRVEVVD